MTGKSTIFYSLKRSCSLQTGSSHQKRRSDEKRFDNETKQHRRIKQEVEKDQMHKQEHVSGGIIAKAN